MTIVLEPTIAERARTAAAAARHGILATLDVDGRPVVSPVPVVADGAGFPVAVLSKLATHSERATQDHRASISLGDRLLLQGDLEPVPGIQQHELTPAFVHTHPELQAQVESLDFSWWRLVPSRVRWFDDDGVERWLRPEDLAGAAPDPLLDLGPTLMADVADRLGDELILLCKALAGRWLATSATLVGLDRYGLVALVDEPGSRRPARIPFPDRLDEAADVHAAVGALVRAARSAPSAERPSSGFVSTPSRPPKPDVSPDELLAALAADAGLLDPVEGDGGGDAGVEGVDGAAHRDADEPIAGEAVAVGSSEVPAEFLWGGPVEQAPAVVPQRSLFDSLEQAGREAGTLGTDDDGDPIVGADDELVEGDRVLARGECEEAESVTPEHVEAAG